MYEGMAESYHDRKVYGWAKDEKRMILKKLSRVQVDGDCVVWQGMHVLAGSVSRLSGSWEGMVVKHVLDKISGKSKAQCAERAWCC